MDKIVIKTNQLYWLMMLILAIGLSLGGLILIVNDSYAPAKIAGWGCAIFFGAGIPLFIWRLIDSRPQLVIDDTGIYARSLKIGAIPWTEIEGAYLKSIHGQDFVCLQVKDYEKYLPKPTQLTKALAATNVALGFSPISLPLSGIKVDINQVCELILKKSTEARQKQ